MSRLKVWVVILAVIIVIGAVGYKIVRQPLGDTLTVKQIVRTLEKGDIKLGEIQEANLPDTELNGHKPAIFQVGDTADTLLIYTLNPLWKGKNS